MTVVTTRLGAVEGTTDEGVQVFRGIPYAAPPVGELRLRPPAPALPWDGVRTATSFSAIAPQAAAAISAVGGDTQPQSEDCLYLNVWTPAADDGRRPVMVWIHGGAFMTGSGSSPLYRGPRLAARGDVVVVTINYRLGMLGWMASPELASAPGAPAGNWGLLDQIAALEWVRDNIAAFGGDPDNVTIFGESAGSVSVSTLLGTPAARGLFHKVIAQSGGPGGFSMRFAERFAGELVDACGVESLSALRDLSLEELFAGYGTLVQKYGRLATPTSPVLDGSVLVDRPLDAIRQGLNADVPLLVGSNRDEMTYFALGDRRLTGGDAELVRRRLARTVGEERVDDMLDAYAKARADRGLDNSPFDLWVAIESDRMFRVPSLRMAESHAAAGAPVYDYLFDWESPAAGGMLRSCHALDLPFVWGTLDQPGMQVFAGTGAEAEALAATMMDAWLAFARTGNPSGGAVGEWPTYDGERRATMRLGRTVEVIEAPMEQERAAWEGFATGRMS